MSDAQLAAEQKAEAASYFQAIDDAIATSSSWPSDAPAGAYRKIAMTEIADARKDYDAELASGVPPVLALDHASTVLAMTAGATADANAQTPFDAAHDDVVQFVRDTAEKKPATVGADFQPIVPASNGANSPNGEQAPVSATAPADVSADATPVPSAADASAAAAASPSATPSASEPLPSSLTEVWNEESSVTARFGPRKAPQTDSRRCGGKAGRASATVLPFAQMRMALFGSIAEPATRPASMTERWQQTVIRPEERLPVATARQQNLGARRLEGCRRRRQAPRHQRSRITSRALVRAARRRRPRPRWPRRRLELARHRQATMALPARRALVPTDPASAARRRLQVPFHRPYQRKGSSVYVYARRPAVGRSSSRFIPGPAAPP